MKLDHSISLVRKRLHTFIKSWPESLAGEFLEHYNKPQLLSRHQINCRPANPEYPVWVLLPSWLLDKYSFNRKLKLRNFLEDLLWAQFCLFFFMRIQDDLFDGHTENTSLIFASNLFFLEAQNTLSQHFRSLSGFWPIFRDSIKTSWQSIVETATLQNRFVTSPSKLIAGYAGTAALFNIGIAALCTKCRQMNKFPLFAGFITEMIIAGQIIDDLQDIEEDFQNGKYNYAANLLLRHYGIRVIKKRYISEQIRKAIFISDGINSVFREVRRHLTLAEQAIAGTGIPEARSLIQNYQAGMDKLQTSFYRNRVKFFFAGLKGIKSGYKS